jgi:protein-tyrosine-phosphatase
MEPRLKVLILCTGNSARSQMAEALLRRLSHGRIDVASAGTIPQPAVHPVARQVLEEKFGIATDDLRPKNLDVFLADRFDVVITVCDRAAESCPVFPGTPLRIHWSFEDPAAVQPPEAQRRAFEQVADGLIARIRLWMSLPDIRRRVEVDDASF